EVVFPGHNARESVASYIRRTVRKRRKTVGPYQGCRKQGLLSPSGPAFGKISGTENRFSADSGNLHDTDPGRSSMDEAGAGCGAVPIPRRRAVSSVMLNKSDHGCTKMYTF